MDTKQRIRYYTKLIEELKKNGSDEELFWAYFERGLYYIEDHEYELAISDFKDAISIKEEPIVYYNMGVAFNRIKDNEKAKLYFLKVIEMDPKNPFAYFELANIFHNEGDYKKALEYYTQSIKNGKKGSDIYYKRAITNFKLLQKTQAISDISHAIRIKPSNTDYYMLRANIYLSMKEFNLAIEDLNHLIMLKPSHGIYRLNRAIIYATIGSLIKLFVKKSIEESVVKYVEKIISAFSFDYHKYYRIAEDDINMAIEIEKKTSSFYVSPSYYITRGAILLSYGREVEAMVDFSTAKIILKSYFISKKSKELNLIKSLVDLYLENYDESWRYIDNNEFDLSKINILRACWYWKKERDYDKTYFWFNKAVENGFDIFEVVDDIFEGYFLKDFLKELEKKGELRKFLNYSF